MWVVHGLPLAWKKGMIYGRSEDHTCIGVTFQVMEDNTVAMGIPKGYVGIVGQIVEVVGNGCGQLAT